MFNLFRSREKSVRWVLGGILGVISLSMLVYLIPGGPGSGGPTSANVLATVGGEKVTASDVQGAVERMMESQRNIPRAFMAMYVPSVVNQYVEMYAKAYKARQMGLTVSDEELADNIQRMMAPQMGGKFDKSMYAAMLQERGFSVADFENFLRVNLLAGQYDAIASQALVVTDQDAKREYDRENEKVALDFVQFSQSDFTKKVPLDSAAINSWFAKHRTEFRVPEKRSFDLIFGSDADFTQAVNVSDSELRRRYQENIDSYRTPERVHVRHILIKTTGVPKQEVPKLKEKAEDILKQLKSGADFAALAKKDSNDPGSAEKGGDLGWIVRGQTVPDFEKAAFSLKPDELSGVITTEYGFHILQVLQHDSPHVQSFDDVKPQLLAEAQKEIGSQNMQRAVASAREETARNPSQATAIANKFGLKFMKVDQVASSAPIPGLNKSPEMTSAIFSTAKGDVTQVIPFDNGGKAGFGITTNIFPSRQAAFDDVQKEVVDRYTEDEAARMMQDAAKQAAARARAGEDLKTIAKAEGGQFKTAAPFTIMGAAEGLGPATTVADAFGPKAKPGDIVGPVTAAGSIYICKITQKDAADPAKFAANRDAMIQTLKQKKGDVQGALFGDSLVADLKKRGVVKLNQAAIERLSASYRS